MFNLSFTIFEGHLTECLPLLLICVVLFYSAWIYTVVYWCIGVLGSLHRWLVYNPHHGSDYNKWLKRQYMNWKISTKLLRYINLQVSLGRSTVLDCFLLFHLWNQDYIAGATGPYIILNFPLFKLLENLILSLTVFTKNWRTLLKPPLLKAR